MPQDRDYLRNLIKLAGKHGITVERTNGGHLKLIAANGSITFTSSSPSDHRSYRNLRGRLINLGLIDRPKRSKQRRARKRISYATRNEIWPNASKLNSKEFQSKESAPAISKPVIRVDGLTVRFVAMVGGGR